MRSARQKALPLLPAISALRKVRRDELTTMVRFSDDTEEGARRSGAGTPACALESGTQ